MDLYEFTNCDGEPEMAHPAIYLITVLDRVIIGGVEYLWISTDPVGHVFAPEDAPEDRKTIPHEHFWKLLTDKVGSVEHGFYAPVKATDPPVMVWYDELSRVDLASTMFLSHLCAEFIRARHCDQTVTLSNTSLTRVLPRLRDQIYARGLGDHPLVQYRLPSPSTFIRQFQRYVDSGCDPAVLAEKRRVPAATPVSPEEHDIWMAFACRYADRLRPTMAELFKELRAAIAKKNSVAQKMGHPLVRPPSRRRFENLIRSLDPHTVAVARFGEAAARRLARKRGGFPPRAE